MNCFNIREIQGILKRKFFTDLFNSNDHHDLLNSTMVGLRYKTNGISSIDQNMTLFYNYGTLNTPKVKYLSYKSKFLDQEERITFFRQFVSFYNLNCIFNFLSNLKDMCLNIIILFTKDLVTIKLNLLNINFLLTNLKPSLLVNYLFLPNSEIFNKFFLSNSFNTDTNSNSIKYSSELTNNFNATFDTSFKGTEYTNSFRYLRFFNPLISYDYKSGNYLGI
jgi:hypothetical protein